MNNKINIKKIVFVFLIFGTIVFMKNYSNAYTGFKSFDNSPRMTIKVNSEKYDDVVITFRDFSSLDPNKIKFYTAENGKIGNEITASDFLAKDVEKHYGTKDTSILVDCVYTISNKYLNKKTNSFYVTVADKYNSDCKLEAFFRIKNSNGKYSADSAPRVKDWKINNGIVSFIVQDWVGVNYVKLYDMYGNNPAKEVFTKTNLPRGNNKVSFSLTLFTQKNGKYKIKIITQDSNKTYKQMATRVVNFSLDDSIKLNKTSITLEKGKTEKLTATTSNSITWSSSNTSVAAVKDGTVTAKAKGTATITVTASNGKTATCEVKVTESSTAGTIRGKQKLIESLRYAYRFSTQAGGHITYINSSNGDHRNRGRLEKGYSDCSWFVFRVYEHTGMMKKFVHSLDWGYHGCPKTEDVAVFNKGQKWDYSNASPGDVIWEHYGGGRSNHVYIYLGNGKQIECSSGHAHGKAVNVGKVRRANSSTIKYKRKIVHFKDFPKAPNSYFDLKTQTIMYK